jgi:hypothetical protein
LPNVNVNVPDDIVNLDIPDVDIPDLNVRDDISDIVPNFNPPKVNIPNVGGGGGGRGRR